MQKTWNKCFQKNPICCSLKMNKLISVKKILVSGLGIWSDEQVICLFRGYKETKTNKQTIKHVAVYQKKIDLYKNRKKEQLGIIVYHIFMDEK